MDNQQKNFDSIYRPTGPRVQVHMEQFGRTLAAPPPAKPKRRFLKTTMWVLLSLLIVFTAYAAFRYFSLSSKVFVGKKAGFFSQVSDILRGSTGTLTLAGEKEGQINVLLLGIGGAGHDGPYLSDTIMLAQIRPSENKVSLTSIPRDYLVNIKGYGDRKINAAFAEGFAKAKNWDEAGKLTREVVGQLAGVDIPYFAVIDFQGFEKAINQVGGLDIEIERTFTDYTYPDNNNGYLPAVTFKEGREHMNGTRALIFSRSRHAAGIEGSDFARSARQHKVIQTFKDKVVSLNLVSDLGTVNNLVNTFADHFHTNLSAGEILHLYNLTKDLPKDTIVSVSLDPSTKLVCSGTVETTGAYIIEPCYGKTNQDIKDFFKNSFVIGKLTEEKSVIWIATANASNRAYKQTESKLTALGMTVWPITYTEVIPEDSVLYQVNSKPATMEYLKNLLQAREVTVAPPSIKIDTTRSDIIIILGSNLKIDPLAPPKPTPPPTKISPPPPEPIDGAQL